MLDPRQQQAWSSQRLRARLEMEGVSPTGKPWPPAAFRVKSSCYERFPFLGAPEAVCEGAYGTGPEAGPAARGPGTTEGRGRAPGAQGLERSVDQLTVQLTTWFDFYPSPTALSQVLTSSDSGRILLGHSPETGNVCRLLVF